MGRRRSSGRIHAISFVDISYSWGPAIHFVELWNEYARISNRPIVGYAVLERQDKPYTQVNFTLKPLRLYALSGLGIRRIGKAMFDISLFFRFLCTKETVVYIRLSRFGIFLLVALLIRNHKVYLEVNGLTLEDSVHGLTTRRLLAVWYSRLLERFYMKLRNATVIAVAPNIASTVRERYGVSDALTIKNGCDRFLVERFAKRDESRRRRLNIGFLGTFTPWDGHERTADLYRALKRTGREVVFHIAGPGAKATDVYREFHDNQDFRFYETIAYKDLWKFYSRLDAAYALDRIDRSRSVEQSTLKLLEYWASRIPIVSTRASGNEFVDEYRIGLLLNDEELNDRELLYQRMLVFLENIEEYRKSYQSAPVPRTWRDVAQDTKKVIESRSSLQVGIQLGQSGTDTYFRNAKLR